MGAKWCVFFLGSIWGGSFFTIISHFWKLQPDGQTWGRIGVKTDRVYLLLGETFRCREVSLVEVSLAKVGPVEVGPAEGGPAEIGLDEIGLAEAGSAEIGLAEAGPPEVGLAEVGTVEVSPAEVGPAEVGIDEGGMADVGLDDVGPTEVSIDEVSIAEIGPAEVGADIWIIVTPSIPGGNALLQDSHMFRISHSVLPLSFPVVGNWGRAGKATSLDRER